MYLVREVFTAVPGKASKLAQMFKKMAGSMNARVMTDMVGPYNTVVMEMEVESMAQWEQQMKDHQSGKGMEEMDEETKEGMSHYFEMYQSGRREIYKIVD